ncbi:MAG: glycosyltransferase family 2 protein [Nitrososphaeria archaeon]
MQVPKEQVTIILPTLNEEKAIGPVIDELQTLGYTNIIVVDGHSTDNTTEIAESKGAKVITQEGRGKADAIKTAVEHVKTPYMLIMDADYTYDPRHINHMTELAPKYDEVIGVRATGRENIPTINRLGNKILTIFFNLLFGTNVKDICSGMYLIKTEIAKGVWYESNGFSIEMELAAHVASTTRKITDVDINYRPRKGKQKLRKLHGLQIALDAIKLAWGYNPTFIIFIIGALTLIPANIILAYVAYELIFNGVNHHIWAIIGVNLAGIGIISLLLSIMTLFIKRVEYRINEKLERFNQAIRRNINTTEIDH